MKTYMFSYLVAALVAVSFSAHAQETTARGTQEVQASFSTLKVMIGQVKADLATVSDTANRALDNSIEALSTAKTAKKTADDAMALADAMDKCGAKMKFLDSNKKYPDLRDDDKCVDGSDVIQTARGTVHSLKDGVVTDLEKDPNMVLEFTCGTNYFRETSGGGKDNHDTMCTGGGFYKIQLGQSNGFVDGVSGGFTTPSLAECVGSESASASFFVYKNRLYKGSPVVTPAGVRVVNKNDFMSMSTWNGKVRAQTGGLNENSIRCSMNVIRW